MKKIVCLLLAIVIMMCCLASCGNMSMGFGNYTFTHIHFTDMTEGHCATVETWYDNEGGIEVMTTEYGSMFLSEGSYILFGSDEHCPYCSK